MALADTLTSLAKQVADGPTYILSKLRQESVNIWRIQPVDTSGESDIRGSAYFTSQSHGG